MVSEEQNKVDEHEQWIDIVGYGVYRKKLNQIIQIRRSL